MATTETFSYTGAEQTWTVPLGVDTITLECWGAGGGDAQAIGDPGGYSKGTLSVTPGETLYLYVGGRADDGGNGGAGGWPSGADGVTATNTDGSASRTSGGGGGSSDVRQGGNTTGDIVILAGGGGGAGNTYNGTLSGTDSAGDGGAGGGVAEDGQGAYNGSGGTGGGSGGFTGARGQKDSSDDTIAVAGSGGGGLNGGGGGGAHALNSDNEIGAAGGGGGDGSVAAVSSASMSTAGGNSGDGQISITYTQQDITLSVSQGAEDQLDLSWNDIDGENGYYIYRAQSSGSTTSDYTQIADLAAGSTTYTDTAPEDGERFYYRVEAYDANNANLSNEDSAITVLPAADITSIQNTASGELTVKWEKNDDSTDGSWEVYRSQDGSLGSQVYSTTDLSITSYSDSGLSSETTYYYTVRRVTDHSSADVQSSGVILAPPTDLMVSVSANDATVTWTDNSGSEDGYRVLWRPTGTSTWSESADLSANTESQTVTNLLDGEEYEFTVEVFSSSSSQRSDETPPVATTELPDAQQPTLGNGVEDEISVDWTDVINHGEYNIQYRETSSSTWLAGPTVDEATTSATITGLEDGEEYDVRIRTQTEHVDGAWTSPVAIVTKFPGATGLTLTVDGSNQISGSWTDNSDNEDGFRVQRRDELDPARPTGFGSWQTVQTLDANVTTFTDATLEHNHDYEYRIEAFTEDTTATSGTAVATTDVEYAQYWTLELRRSDGEILTIDGEHFVPPSPQISRAPSRITPWSVEIPETRVLTEENWINTDAFLWFDGGNELVLRGELQKASHPTTAAPQNASTPTTTLEGADVGYEFKHGGARERYQSFEAHLALEDYLTTYFGDWQVSVIEPTVQLIDSDKLIQSADSTSEWDSLYSPPSDKPVGITDGELHQLQSCWTAEGENFSSGTASGDPNALDTYSSGDAARFDEAGDTAKWTFTPQHDIPESAVGVQVRDDDHSDSVEVEWRLNSNVIDTVPDGAGLSLSWSDVGSGYYSGGSGYTGGGLTAGTTYTLEAECLSVSSGTAYVVDVVAPYDSRYSYTWDNDNGGSGGYLDGPQMMPDVVTVELPTVDENRNVPSASITTVWDNTTNNQALAASNDGGSTYGISEPNTQTLDGTFSGPGSLPRAKLTLSRYGSRTTATPKTGFNGQAVDTYEFRVDTNSLAVIDDRTYTGSHLENIQALCDDAGMIWVTPYTETGKEIEAFKPGEVSATLPDVEVLDGDDITDLEQYYNAVRVFGAGSGDGTPLEVMAESQDEIDQYGRREAPAVFEPRLESKADVENQANQLLAEYIAEKDQKATRTIVPKSITPGYSYSVPGLSGELVLREVQFEDGQRGQLRFDDVDDVVAVLTRQSREIKQTKDTF